MMCFFSNRAPTFSPSVLNTLLISSQKKANLLTPSHTEFGSSTFLAYQPQNKLALRLPPFHLSFGWSWGPILAHSSAKRVLHPLRSLLPDFCLYIDVVLLFQSDPHFLSFCTHYATHLFTEEGFLLNSKNELKPSFKLFWLGKSLHSRPTHTYICNAPPSHLCGLSGPLPSLPCTSYLNPSSSPSRHPSMAHAPPLKFQSFFLLCTTN